MSIHGNMYWVGFPAGMKGTVPIIQCGGDEYNMPGEWRS